MSHLIQKILYTVYFKESCVIVVALKIWNPEVPSSNPATALVLCPLVKHFFQMVYL